MRDKNPVSFVLPQGAANMYIFVHPREIEEVVVKKAKSFSKDRITRSLKDVIGEGLLTSEGEKWRNQRRLSQPAFHQKQLQSYEMSMQRRTAELVENWSGCTRVEVHHTLMRLTLRIVLDSLFGEDLDDVDETVSKTLDRWMERYSHAYYRLFPWVRGLPLPRTLKARRAQKELVALLEGWINLIRPQAATRKDLLSSLITTAQQEGGRLTTQEVRDQAITLLLAGHETTANSLSWTLWVLAKHPDIQAKMRDPAHGKEWVLAVIKESMRLYPTVWIFGREATEDCEIGDQKLRKGDTANVLPYLMHRDPRWFDQPLEFKPERWLDAEFVAQLPKFAYFPFGGGPRVCIGSQFAMMEAVMILTALVSNFEFMDEPGQKVTPKPSVTLRPESNLKSGLTLRLKPVATATVSNPHPQGHSTGAGKCPFHVGKSEEVAELV